MNSFLNYFSGSFFTGYIERLQMSYPVILLKVCQIEFSRGVFSVFKIKESCHLKIKIL